MLVAEAAEAAAAEAEAELEADCSLLVACCRRCMTAGGDIVGGRWRAETAAEAEAEAEAAKASSGRVMAADALRSK